MSSDEASSDRSSPDASRRSPSDPSPVPTSVEFRQRTGDGWLEWKVVEMDALGVPGARGDRCLVFSRTDCIRRVWNYPAHWRDLPDEELAALSWGR